MRVTWPWATAFTRHARVSVIAILACMLLLRRVFSLIHPPSLILIISTECLALGRPRRRQTIEISYLIGLPLYCALGAQAVSSIAGVGQFLALGLVGSVYGLIWFGLDPESRAPGWRLWATAIPILALADSLLLIPARHLPHAFRGDGLGATWLAQVTIAVAAVVGFALWRPLNRSAIWSFGAAVTLCIAMRTFQNVDQANAFDVALAFLPYIAALVTARVGRPASIIVARREALFPPVLRA